MAEILDSSSSVCAFKKRLDTPEGHKLMIYSVSMMMLRTIGELNYR